MPYRTEWVHPDVFIEHAGVTVYRIYKSDDVDQGARMYWFSTRIDGSDDDAHGTGGTFDVRMLDDWDVALIEDDSIKQAIASAIDRGLITADGFA